MKISMIYSTCRDLINCEGGLPLDLEEQAAYFDKFVGGQIVIMDRKAVEALPAAPNNYTLVCLASEKGYEHPFADVVLASKRKVFEWCEENDVANLVIAGGISLYNLFVKDCNRVIQSRLNHTLIPVKIFRHMKGKVFAPDLRVKGPWDSAEVLEKSNKMVVVEYVWRGGAVQ